MSLFGDSSDDLEGGQALNNCQVHFGLFLTKYQIYLNSEVVEILVVPTLLVVLDVFGNIHPSLVVVVVQQRCGLVVVMWVAAAAVVGAAGVEVGCFDFVRFAVAVVAAAGLMYFVVQVAIVVSVRFERFVLPAVAMPLFGQNFVDCALEEPEN